MFIKKKTWNLRNQRARKLGNEYVEWFQKTTKKGVPSINLLSLGVNALKDLTYSRLSILQGSGKCHFPKSSTQGYGLDYFKGLTAEVKVKKSTPRGIKLHGKY